ncbi:MAG: hypothetical protein ACI92S_002628 [Planctomycetaceae bacterium]|jgi:hypothetical protein
MPELKPSLDSDFLAPGPLLRWLAETLEAAEEASHGQLQIAALECAENSNFAIDGDLELAGSLLAGHEGRESSINQALNAQLKRDIEQFAQNFFRHDLESRQFLFEELRKRCVENSTLADRLGLLERGLQVDTAALVELEGDVAHLAELAIELFVLPLPKQSRVRRERLREIFTRTEGGAFADAPEWRGVVKLLRISQPQIASLDEALMQHLTWSPGGKKRARSLSRAMNWLNDDVTLLRCLTSAPALILIGVFVVAFASIVNTFRNSRPVPERNWSSPTHQEIKSFEIDRSPQDEAMLESLGRILAQPVGSPDTPAAEEVNALKAADESMAPNSNSKHPDAAHEESE